MGQDQMGRSCPWTRRCQSMRGCSGGVYPSSATVAASPSARTGGEVRPGVPQGYAWPYLMRDTPGMSGHRLLGAPG